MTTRQSGHFFFEPKSYDHLNQATHAHKEEIKVGYNLFRKAVLMAIWADCPVLLLRPDLFGLVNPHTDGIVACPHAGRLWFWLAVGGLLFRTVQLFFVRDVLTGLVWASKIVTDPFNDIRLYHKAPSLLRRELIDPLYWSKEVTPRSHDRRLKPAPAENLAEDPAADGAMGERWTLPPAVGGHPPGGGDEALLDLGEGGVAISEAEDEPAGADPAQRQSGVAQIILEHPVIAAGRGVIEGPDRREVGDSTGWPPPPAGR